MLNVKYHAGVLTLAAGVLVSGCQNYNTVNTYPTAPVYGYDNQTSIQKPIKCAPFDPNEMVMCTQHYDPVCTTVRMPDSSTKLRTAGNSCSACSLPDVISYVDGECEY